MYKMEIKREFDENVQSQCRGCLSLSRKLTSIEKYYDLYCKLLVDNLYGISSYSIEDIQLCWECISLLQKISKFQQQVRKANEMFRIGQNVMYGTLSSLTTVIIHDTHPNIIYVNEANIPCDLIKQVNQNDESNDSISNNDDTECITEEINLKCDVKIESISNSGIVAKGSAKIDKPNLNNDQKPVKKKAKYKNKWAVRRALLNKKPKFKILTTQELVINKYIRKAALDTKTVKICMEKDRDGDGFRKSRFKCESCVVAFKKESLLIKHLDVFHNKATFDYICDICKRRMQQKKVLARHIKRHFVRYECSLCEFSCRKKEDTITHLNNAHKKVFQCLKCKLSFSHKQEFLKHYKAWHEHFVCDHCGVSFKMRYCIKDHIKKQHSTFECLPCNKRFSRYNGLWFHNKVCHAAPAHDGAARNAAYCVECDKRFADVYRYKWHLHNSVKHTPKKKIRIPCPDCDKVFSKNIYMKDHRNLVHLKNFKYRCEECDKNFVRNADLVKHRRRVHEGVLPPRNKICYVCGRGFTTNEILTHHLRTHTGERPHRCAACPAAFAQRAARTAHARRAHRRSPGALAVSLRARGQPWAQGQ